jgi:hypothetical protein
LTRRRPSCHIGFVTSTLATVLEFLRSIGIEAQAGEVDADSFLPGVRIVDGGLVFVPQRLRWPCDLLHEAGHIAVTPAEQRASLGGALDAAEAAPWGGELEAMAWSWAATLHLGLRPAELFHPEGYKGQSAALLLTYSLGVCPGAVGLAQTGMTLLGEGATSARLPPYPHMQRWLR